MENYIELTPEIRDKMIEAAQKIIDAFDELARRIVEALKRVFEAMADLMRKIFRDAHFLRRYARLIVKYRAKRLEWRASGPRRNRALARAILARWYAVGP